MQLHWWVTFSDAKPITIVSHAVHCSMRMKIDTYLEDRPLFDVGLPVLLLQLCLSFGQRFLWSQSAPEHTKTNTNYISRGHCSCWLFRGYSWLIPHGEYVYHPKKLLHREQYNWIVSDLWGASPAVWDYLLSPLSGGNKQHTWSHLWGEKRWQPRQKDDPSALYALLSCQGQYILARYQSLVISLSPTNTSLFSCTWANPLTNSHVCWDNAPIATAVTTCCEFLVLSLQADAMPAGLPQCF